MNKTVWHYTSENAIYAIQRTNQFSPSFFKQTDTTYGQGWYVTDLAPSTPIQELCDYLWTDHSPTTQEKTKAYVKLEIDEKYLSYCRPHVYLLKLESVPSKVLDVGKTYEDNNKNIVIRFIEATLNFFRKK
jgi:hypothetical protein